MHRRTLLCAAAGATGLLAGCLDGEAPAGRTGTPGTDESTPRADDASPTGTGDDGSGGDGGTGTPSDDGTETGTATDGDTAADDDTETPTETDDATRTETDRGTATDDGSGSNELVDRSFEVGGTECGQGANRAAVSRGDDRVVVDGTIRGSNGCYTAELEDATYDEESDELLVAVRAYDDSDGDEGCMESIVDVDYRASFEFRDGTPEEVTVVHDGEHVTTG